MRRQSRSSTSQPSRRCQASKCGRQRITHHGRLPDGNYGLRIPATAIRDVAGNAATADVTFDTFALDGDANRDRAVNLADFGVLRGNFGASGGFRQGDFNNDGVINLADFGILRGNFGTTLTPPASLFADDADQFATAAATTSSR